jgi:hypothetical protein
MLPRAILRKAVDGYDHLDSADRPYVGRNGITDEQRLWHHFILELAIRRLHQFNTDQQHRSYLSDQFSRLDSLPVDR